MKKCEVTTMEGGTVENAGAVFYHLIGDKHFFHIASARPETRFFEKQDF